MHIQPEDMQIKNTTTTNVHCYNVLQT
jgi:hypothetical protein